MWTFDPVCHEVPFLQRSNTVVLVFALQAAHPNSADIAFPSLTYQTRLLKEATYYKKEVEDNEITLEAMKSSGKDPYDIKQFEKVLAESYMMVPDSERRLKQSLEDLSCFLESCDGATINRSSDWYATAQEIVQEKYGDKGDQDFPKTNIEDLGNDEEF